MPIRNKLLHSIDTFIKWLQLKRNKIAKNSEIEIGAYNSLSPIADADHERHYSKALIWALKTRKENDIKNIALTGPYGSGKSSILKTFQNNYNDGDLHFLSISLATFKEEITPPTPKGNSEGKAEDLLRLIELSILQQIFYHEEDNKIPDSRFKKIKSYKSSNIFLAAIGFLAIIVSALNLHYPNLIQKLLRVNFSPLLESVIHFTTLALLFLGVFFIILNSIRFLAGITITKLNIQNAEFAINEKVNKSILNHHIDEILYFFEVRPYNVVVIEDLDRFKQTEIFTKLREINLLINNSKKIDKDVVFIYAVRDDMFDDKERTKFFDFIIPVIPVINSSNSNEILLNKREVNQYNLTDNLIDDISLFIDDMRLLHNVMNEFYIYYQHLNKTLSHDKLLAILVYKNIFPNDFTLLTNNDGKLYDAINNKQDYIKAEISVIEQEILNIKEEIKQLNSLKIRDIKELNSLYTHRYIFKLGNFISFTIDGKKYNSQSVLEDDIFEYLKEDKTIVYSSVRFHHSSYYIEETKAVDFTFEEVEKEVDASFSYNERRKQIDEWNNNKVELLKRKVQELENEKTKKRNLKIKELLSKGLVSFDTLHPKQNNLVNVLLRNGYIDEDYLDYISIFYEGSITQSDNQFLLNVKSQATSPPDYKLIKIEKLAEKINPIEFQREFILNYDLVDYVVSNLNHKEAHTLLFKQLKNESQTSLTFIDGYLKNGNNVDLFVKSLCKYWVNIGNYILEESDFPSEDLYTYFRYILDYADVNDIINISQKTSYRHNDITSSYESIFVRYIIDNPEFLELITDKEKLKELISELNIKFENLAIDTTPEELLNYIYTNNHYSLDAATIMQVMKFNGHLNQVDFKSKNYFTIQSSNLPHLIRYINDNIAIYVTNVYLKLNDNSLEEENSLIQLLNKKELDAPLKALIIDKIETKVNDINTITQLEIADILLAKSKVLANWDNVYSSYLRHDSNFSESIISFISEVNNALQLSKTVIQQGDKEETEFENFIDDLIKTEGLDNYAYALILESIPYKDNKLSFAILSEEKISLLIDKKKLELNEENYNTLKSTSTSNLHIKLIEVNKAKFIREISEYELDNDDVLHLLKSRAISDEEKNILIEEIDISYIASNRFSLREIGELILRNRNFRVDKAIFELVLLNTQLSSSQRISIFNMKHNLADSDLITNFLISLPEPYSNIAINGKKPLIKEITDFNRKFVTLLDSIDYISNHEIERRGIRIYTYRNK